MLFLPFHQYKLNIMRGVYTGRLDRSTCRNSKKWFPYWIFIWFPSFCHNLVSSMVTFPSEPQPSIPPLFLNVCYIYSLRKCCNTPREHYCVFSAGLLHVVFFLFSQYTTVIMRSMTIPWHFQFGIISCSQDWSILFSLCRNYRCCPLLVLQSFLSSLR